jgi:hypothetical protein
MRRMFGFISIACLLVGTVAAQDRPLPEREAFLRETRKHLQTDTSLQSSYVFVETRREQKLDSHGRVQEESVKVFENYPGLPGEGRWERLIAEDGRPRPAAELEKVDRDRQRQAEALARRLTEQPAKEQARQERNRAERQREFDAIVDDISIVFDIELRGREVIEGHDTILLSLTPRPKARPRTREGRQMQKLAIRAWISESNHELVRLHAEAIDTLTTGFGLLARLHKGSQLSFLRRRVNDEVWMPAFVEFRGSARVGLVRTLRRSGTSEFSDYRKFSVDTDTTYQPPETQ